MAFRVTSSLLRTSKRNIVHLPNVHRSQVTELPPKMLDASLILKNRNLPDLTSSKKPKDLEILNAVRNEKHVAAIKAKGLGIERVFPAKFPQHEKNEVAPKHKVPKRQESELKEVEREKSFYPYADGFGYWEK